MYPKKLIETSTHGRSTSYLIKSLISAVPQPPPILALPEHSFINEISNSSSSLTTRFITVSKNGGERTTLDLGAELKTHAIVTLMGGRELGTFAFFMPWIMRLGGSIFYIGGFDKFGDISTNDHTNSFFTDNMYDRDSTNLYYNNTNYEPPYTMIEEYNYLTIHPTPDVDPALDLFNRVHPSSTATFTENTITVHSRAYIDLVPNRQLKPDISVETVSDHNTVQFYYNMNDSSNYAETRWVFNYTTDGRTKPVHYQMNGRQIDGINVLHFGIPNIGLTVEPGYNHALGFDHICSHLMISKSDAYGFKEFSDIQLDYGFRYAGVKELYMKVITRLIEKHNIINLDTSGMLIQHALIPLDELAAYDITTLLNYLYNPGRPLEPGDEQWTYRRKNTKLSLIRGTEYLSDGEVSVYDIIDNISPHINSKFETSSDWVIEKIIIPG